jgi:magnesium-transporting ATPase (P-type)
MQQLFVLLVFLLLLISLNEGYALQISSQLSRLGGFRRKLPSSFRAGHTVETSSALHTQSVLPPSSLTAIECLDQFQVSESIGLSTPEADKRLQAYGENKLTEAPPKSLLSLVAEQFEDRLVQILLGVAVFSASLAAFERDYHAIVETGVILAILILNAFVGILQTKSAESSLEALKKLQPALCSVLRDGEWRGQFPTSNLVPGDIIYLKVGDKVPADARIIYLKTNSFSVDEACLTGESVSVQKSIHPIEARDIPLSGRVNMVFSGTLVTQGSCCAVITATGAATEIGKINAGVQEAKMMTTKTPLAEKLDEFGNKLAKGISVVCLMVFLTAIPKFSNKMFKSPLLGAAHYAKVAVALGKVICFLFVWFFFHLKCFLIFFFPFFLV